MSDLTIAELDALEKLAEKATPGPWIRAWRRYSSEAFADVQGPAEVTVVAGTIYNNAANTEYIAAVNPKAILALVALARKRLEAK